MVEESKESNNSSVNYKTKSFMKGVFIMKKINGTVLIMVMLVMVFGLTACKPKEETPAEPTKAPTAAPTTAPQVTEPAPAGTAAEVTEVDLGAYLSDDSKWEDDSGDYSIENNALVFNNAFYGDFCAVRLADQFQNVNTKFTLQLTDIAADLSEDAGTWWDSEFLLLVRSNYAGASFVEGNDPQAGYCITAWGDMKQFALGRSGYDDVFGVYDWPLADGQPHKVEFTVANNADNTQVTLKVVVDGVELATAVDDGSQVKKERPSLYPNAGGITLRCKYLGAMITGFDAASAAAGTDNQAAGSEAQTVLVGDYFSDASAWEDDGGDYTLSDTGIVFNTTEPDQTAAVRLNKESQNGTVKFSLQFTDIDKELSMDEGTWWNSEFLCLLRSKLADKGYTEGQAGYSLVSWGDMSTFFLGRSGYDDAFGEFSWPMGDGQAHDFEITLQNNADNTSVTITVKIDGQEVASVVDDGTKVKEDRPALYPEAGGVTFRCVDLGVTVGASK
jgi:hypothetical protein